MNPCQLQRLRHRPLQHHLQRRHRKLEARDMLVRLEDRFDALPVESTEAPLTYARDLLEGSISDLNQIEEIMTDG